MVKEAKLDLEQMDKGFKLNLGDFIFAYYDEDVVVVEFEDAENPYRWEDNDWQEWGSHV